MTKPAVLITSIEADLPIAESLLQELRAAEIPCQLLPPDKSVEELHGIISQIHDTITSFGVMIVLLSKKSAYDHRIISNTQYACELAKRRAVLVIYQIEEVPLENPLALYYSQSVLINNSKRKNADPQEVVSNVKRILDHSKTPAAFRPRRLSPKATKRLVIGGTIIGLLIGIGSALWSGFIANAEEPQPAISTPVVFEDPYSEQSLDQDIVIDVRSAPERELYGAPAVDAPFYFQPEFIHKAISFDDSTYDGLVNYGEIEYMSSNITSYDKVFLQQMDDVLQISVAPHDMTMWSGFPIKHAFASNELNYLGFRFRYSPYLGWLNAGDEINLFFEATSNGPKDFAQLAKLSLVQQEIELPQSLDNAIFPCDEGWHTLEFLSDDPSDRYDVYLDGTLIGKTNPLATNQYWVLSLVLDHPSNTDWVSLYLDEIVFGGNQPLLKANGPEEVPYAVTPDEITYHYTFDTFLPEEYLLGGRDYAWLENDVMKFSVKETDGAHIGFSFPITPINETNYASMKYRFTGDSPDYWADWGGASIGIERAFPLEESWQGISIEAFRYHPEYSLSDGNTIDGVLGSEENLNLGGWHTMEIVVEPLSVENDQYLLRFFNDGIFVAEIEIDPVENLLDPENHLVCYFSFYSDGNNQGAFSGEVDEITVGFIAFPELTEE